MLNIPIFNLQINTKSERSVFTRSMYLPCQAWLIGRGISRDWNSNCVYKKAKKQIALNFPYVLYSCGPKVTYFFSLAQESKSLLGNTLCKQTTPRQCDDCQQGSTEFSTALIILQSEIKSIIIQPSDVHIWRELLSDTGFQTCTEL